MLPSALVGSSLRLWLILWTSILVLREPASAARKITSKSLSTCMKNSQFTASLFDVSFDPTTRTIDYNVEAISNLDGYVYAIAVARVYGIKILEETLDPCSSSLNLKQLCPMSPGTFDINSSSTLGSSINLPGVAFTIPDLDAIVEVTIHNRDNDNTTQLACVQATLSNGKTVYQPGVGWATAVISGVGLFTAGFVSVRGFSKAASHIAVNSLALYGYFQTMAIINLQALAPVPPIARAWGQNFSWALGIIRVTFMQQIFTWYVRATGGEPSSLLSVTSLSILIQKKVKRSLEAIPSLLKRASDETTLTENERTEGFVLKGIERVAYIAKIEITNLFLTVIVIFLFFCVAVTVAMAIFKFGSDLLCRIGAINSSRFSEFRQSWVNYVKGTMYRMVLLAYPQIMLFSLWQFYERDSAACIVFACAMIVVTTGLLAWGSFKVYMIARRSLSVHKNAAYALYADPVALNRWGFLYSPYRAPMYFFMLPTLGYNFLKACFIAFAQESGHTQGLAFFIIELFWLIIICVKKPFLDKSTNGINIAIQVINTLDAMFFLFFSGLMTQPQVVSSVMGVIYFVLNAAFSLALLLMIIISCAWVLFMKNPDGRYQPMKDDRESFIKTGQMGGYYNTELDALGQTTRGVYGEGMEDPSYVKDPQKVYFRDEDTSSMYRTTSSSRSASNLPSRNNVVREEDSSSSPSDSPFADSSDTSYRGYIAPSDAAYHSR